MSEAASRIDLLSSYVVATRPHVASEKPQLRRLNGLDAHEFNWHRFTYFAPDDAIQAGDSYLEKNMRKPDRHLRIVSLLSFLSGPGVMLDVGANIGLTSIPRATLGMFDHVHAFEPEPKNFACLDAAIEANDIRDRMTAWNLAIGENPSRGTLCLRLGMARHDLAADPDRCDVPTVPIEITSLDAWLEAASIAAESVRFVKVDVQGYEPFVLRGAAKLLSLGKAVWQIEATPKLFERYGVSQEVFANHLRQNFDWFCDLEHVREGFRPISDLRPDLELGDRKFTDLILFRRS